MTSPFVAGVPQPLHPSRPHAGVTAPPSQRPAAHSSPPARSAGGDPRGTMLGVAPPPGVAEVVKAARAALNAPSAVPPAPGHAPASAAPLSAKRTMMGVAPPSAMTPAREELARQAAALIASGPPSAPPTAPVIQPPPMAMPPPPMALPQSPQPPISAPPPPAASVRPQPAIRRPLPEQKVAPKSDRTMLGIPANALVRMPTLSATELGATSSAARAFTSPADEEGQASASRRRKKKKRPGVLRPLLAALTGAFVVLLCGLLAWHFYGGPDIGVRIVQGDAGEALEIAVPDAPPDAKVRFASSEQGLRGGVALFPLAADALALGDNELSIGIVRGAAVETTQVRLHVAYRARVDAAALDRPEPALDVVIEALPGSQVTLDGKPLPLDARGRATRSYPVGPQTGSKLAFEARYAIRPPSAPPTEGVLTLALPVTSVQVDRPGSGVTSDQPSIQVAGAAEASAEITIDGQPVKAEGNRFRTQVRLPTVGQHTIRVRARSPGKAPREITLVVTRVADLAKAAASFEPEPELTYARIAQEPGAYRGKKVAFEGRVYNVEVGGGASHLQLLVRDCPRGQRCPLWVELAQASDVAVDTTVRVLGTVAGEQQFRSERGQVHTVPSVQAQYVLKSSR